MSITFDYDQEDWGSRVAYPDGTKTPWVPDKVIIHWGGSGEASVGIDAEMARLRSWQNYHMDSKGWTDIAYNYAVGQSGKVYRLRGENRSGATSGDFEGDGIPENHEGRAVVWIGGAASFPSLAAEDAMERIIRESQEMGQMVVIGHKQVKGNTACPGPDWMRFIAEAPWEYDPPTPPPPPLPPDLNPSDWAAADWAWADLNGLLSANSFPHALVTKEELMVFLRRYNEAFDGMGVDG